MNVYAMKRRCPGAHLWGAARLPCWRFALMTSGYATIIPDVGKNVYGALWEVSIPELNELDRYEEINQGLYVRKEYLYSLSQQDQSKLSFILAKIAVSGARLTHI